MRKGEKEKLMSGQMKIASDRIKPHAILCGIAMALLAVLFMLPVILTLVESFCYDQKLTLHGYQELFLNCFPFYKMFWNSVIYTFVITAGAIVISVFAAVGFLCSEFKGKRLLYVVYIILMMMPLQVMILPNYIGLRDMNLLNTRAAIILPLIFSPLGVVVIHQYMREIDRSMIEAGRLETNSILKIILHCIVPQIKVCIFAAALFLFADTWNIVEQPMLYLNDDQLRTLSAFIAQAQNYSGEVLLPASVLFMIPVLLCYLMYHEELENGLKV